MSTSTIYTLTCDKGAGINERFIVKIDYSRDKINWPGDLYWHQMRRIADNLKSLICTETAKLSGNHTRNYTSEKFLAWRKHTKDTPGKTV